MTVERDILTIVNGPAEGVGGETEVEAHLVADLHCELGEGIIYDNAKDVIYFTDILGRRFHRISLVDGSRESFGFKKMIGSFALRPKDKNGFLCAWEDGFQLYNLEHKAKEGEELPMEDWKNDPAALGPMSVGPKVNHGLPTRLNDGRCDREGKRYICGGYFGMDQSKRMQVFRCETDQESGGLVHQSLISNVRVTNSLCFSPDGGTLYFADSPTRTINRYDYNKSTGDIKKKDDVLFEEPVKTVPDVPDGSCVDVEGFVWNAVWRDGKGSSFVRRLDPVSGAKVFTVKMPDETSQVSCCCFGGKDLDVLFITTAGETVNKEIETHAGGVYAVKLPFKGLPEARFG